MPGYEFPGVHMIYVDKTEVGCTIYDCDDSLYVGTDRRLTTPYEGQLRVDLRPVYEEQPSPAEVNALVERFRMVKGVLPYVVIVVKIVRANHDPAAVAAWRRSRNRHPDRPAPKFEEVVQGYSVILRGAGQRKSA